MNKKTKMCILISIIVMNVVGGYYFYKPVPNYLHPLDDGSIIDLFPVEKVMLKDADDHVNNQLTCTGMTYSPDEKTFYFANYGKANRNVKDKTPSILICDKDFFLKTIY